MLGDFLIQNIFHRGVSGRASERIPAEGRTMVARHQNVGFPPGQERTDGHTARQALGKSHHVRFNAEGFITPELSQTADAGLYLIKNQENTLLIAPVTDFLEIIVVRHDNAAFALDGLQHDGAGFFGGGAF